MTKTCLGIVFDLNGTLLLYSKRRSLLDDIDKEEEKSDLEAGRKRKWRSSHLLKFRPHLDLLLHHVFDVLQCRVGVWTFSGKTIEQSTELMEAAFGKYASRVEFVLNRQCRTRLKQKDLTLLTPAVISSSSCDADDDNKNEKFFWTLENTILIEDSASKVVQKGFNSLMVPSFKRKRHAASTSQQQDDDNDSDLDDQQGAGGIENISQEQPKTDDTLLRVMFELSERANMF